MKTLYLCYFGLREPLVRTQVLPYLRELAAAEVEVYLLTFEPRMRERWTAQTLAEEQASLQREGIKWSALPYHKRPSVPATFYDILAGTRAALRLVRQQGIDVLHARAHIPLAMALLAIRFQKCKLIFDIRGLMAEEYADAGVWTPNSLNFRIIKRLEEAGIRRADQLVVLTDALKKWLLINRLPDANNIEVIPCCVDFASYTGTASKAEATTDRFEVIYAGSVTGLYMLEEMGKFFLEVRARQPQAFLRILTMSSADEAGERLRRVGLEPEDFWIGAVSSGDVPRYLQRACLGLSFRKPTFSQLAASPTKIAEYLAAGLPVVSNAGVGDVDDLLRRESVGVVVHDFTAAELARAAHDALALAADARTSARCVEAGRIHFDLHTVGGKRYLNVYKRLRQ
ncbi:MAG TPA: glycosyltransferase [Pyrinomonadaceae bacterium]|nr:glycosyltransferase [Pyrinomonadaceae bacterium]